MWPKLCAVQHAQNADGIADDAIGCNARCPADDELTGAVDTTWAPQLRKLQKECDLLTDTLVDLDSALRTILFDKIENFIAIIMGK